MIRNTKQERDPHSVNAIHCMSTRGRSAIFPHFEHLVQHLKETGGLRELVVHQVDQQVAIGDVLDQLARGRGGFIEFPPLLPPQPEGLIPPAFEGNGVHHCWLDDLFAREDAPCDSCWLQGVCIGQFCLTL